MQKNVLRISLHFNFEYICNRLRDRKKGGIKKKMIATKRYFAFVRISLEYFQYSRTMMFKMGQMEEKFFGDHRYEIKENSFLTSHALKVSEKVFPTPSMVFARSKFFSVCLQTDNNPTRKKSLFTILNHFDNDKNSKRDKNYSNHEIMIN